MAARSYFGKSAKALSVSEGALLAGLTKGPNYYNPDTKPERAQERMAYVLSRMQDDGFLRFDQVQQAVAALPSRVPFERTRRTTGFHFVDHVGRDARALADIESLSAGGYTVRTTLNPALQQATEAALQEGLARYELGPGKLHLNPVVPDAFTEEEVAEFRAALLRNQQRRGLYSAEAGTVSFLGDMLFRTRIVFPANVPPGDYQVQVLQFADGEVVAAQSSKLEVGKIGIEAELYEFAMGQPALYGAVALLLALGSGWLANLMFRRP